MKLKRKTKPVRAALPSTYGSLLADLKRRVRNAQVRAALSVNRELVLLYWHIGREILRSQQAEGWGAKVIERLAKDLRREFPEMSGLSSRNLKYMRAFAEAYSSGESVQQLAGQFVQQLVAQLPNVKALLPGKRGTSIVQQAVAQLPGEKVPQPVGQLALTKVQQPAAQLEFDLPPEPFASLPWGHNVLLLDRVKNPADRLWYARQALAHGWSRAVLEVQIETKLHKRAGRALNNFAATLPPAQSDLAQQVLKDPYTFNFLALGPDAQERDLENALMDHIQKFLLELGVGFAFVGRQVRLEVDGEDYSLDLLFYHLRLRCFFVIDLKKEAFKPEDAGKMNFYLSAVDDQLRHDGDQPTIGLLLCRNHKRLTVEYALRNMAKPIDVAKWRTRLVSSLPRNLRSALPSVEELERNLRTSS
jgi:predicted nuclease of restriction endonuclease-like (RecB) superfamily